MKIGHPADKTLPAPAAAVAGSAATDLARTAPGAAPVAAAATAADASAKVQISTTAAGLLSSGSTPEFDAAKVARMADAIAGGTFKVNADAIADKLIANAQELLTKVQG